MLLSPMLYSSHMGMLHQQDLFPATVLGKPRLQNPVGIRGLIHQKNKENKKMCFRNPHFQRFLLTNMISAEMKEASGEMARELCQEKFGDDALGPQWWDRTPKVGGHEGLRDPGHALPLLLAHPSCTHHPAPAGEHSTGRAQCRQGSGVTSPASDELRKPEPILPLRRLLVGAANPECLPAPAGSPAWSKRIGIDSAINFQSQAARPRKSNYAGQPCAPANANGAAFP